MELRQLQYFVAVAEALNFRKAADLVHVTQPSVSQQIRELEQELRVKLFVRDRKTVHLTDTGRLLLDKARTVLAQAAEIKELASRANGGQTGRIEVGVDMGIANSIQFLATEYSRQYPPY